MSTTGGEDDETAKLEKMLAGMSDGGGDDDLEQMINALSSDEEGEESVEGRFSYDDIYDDIYIL